MMNRSIDTRTKGQSKCIVSREEWEKYIETRSKTVSSLYYFNFFLRREEWGENYNKIK